MTAELSLDEAHFTAKCKELNLDPHRIKKHINRIKSSLELGSAPSIPITDTCRLDNGGIIASSWQAPERVETSGISSFIPAAGASSRYYKPFGDLIKALESADLRLIKSAVTSLFDQGASAWPLPKVLKSVINNTEIDLNPEITKLILMELSLPKALLPCVEEGNTFLELKIIEDLSLSFLEQSFLVISPRMKDSFDKKLKELNADNFSILFQGPKQSTVRVDEKVNPVVEGDSFSVVPAGHGTLLELFPEVNQSNPNVHSVLIRNVDNIVGTSPEVVKQTKKLVQTHNFIRNGVVGIRQAIDNSDFTVAEKVADQMMKELPSSDSFDTLKKSSASLALWEEAKERYPGLIYLQEKIFHLNPDLLSYMFARNSSIETSLGEVYQRPVNTMGMVPNTENNIGGSPVFALSQDIPIKLCIELPHVSSKDKEKFLIPPEKSTHFNPVFAIAEIPSSPNYYEQFEESSWILAQKTYKGQKVYYHESVLYELISDSLLANCSFIEVPRILFNPHKSISDSARTSIERWKH